MSRHPEDARLIPWQSFEQAFIDPGVPVNVPVEGDPAIHLFTDKGGLLLGLRAETSAEDLADLETPQAVHVDGGDDHFEVWSEDRKVFAPFYALLMDIANRLQIDGASAREALGGALTAWRQMLAAPGLMGPSEQLGLLGELWILERLVGKGGSAVFPAWTGAQRDAHDFRLGEVEIEVKATKKSSRTHVVSSADQLVPSEGMLLCVASIQFENAGLADGWTLPEQIQRVRTLLGDGSDASMAFSQQLQSLGWSDADSAHYLERVRLRTDPTLIAVDGSFPRITTSDLQGVLGEQLNRISGFTYSVNVDGMGAQYPSEDFLDILPLDPQ